MEQSLLLWRLLWAPLTARAGLAGDSQTTAVPLSHTPTHKHRHTHTRTYACTHEHARTHTHTHTHTHLSICSISPTTHLPMHKHIPTNAHTHTPHLSPDTQPHYTAPR